MVFTCTDTQKAQLADWLGNDVAAIASICSTSDVASIGVKNAVLRWSVDKLHEVSTRLESAQAELTGARAGMDAGFVLQSAYGVFMMQAGFALYAAGVIRSKNTFNILMKSFIDACVAGVMFYLFGYAFTDGTGSEGNGFIGHGDFALSNTASADPSPWHKFIWQWSFCAAAATIVSGAVAERVAFSAYLILSIVMSGFIYPAVAHWMWNKDGFLSPIKENPLLGTGAIDFAGSGVVHMVGGFASLVGAYMVGVRIGRFDPDVDPNEFKGRSASTFVLGTFLLWFGWYGFNPGSFLSISSAQAAEVVARTAVCTTLAASAGAVAISLLTFYMTKQWDLLGTCSGALAGLVAITSSCSVVEPWAALVCGVAASYIFYFAETFVNFMHIDDPISAFAMHGCCGAFGVLFTGLMGKKQFLGQVYPSTNWEGRQGVFNGGSPNLVACQLIEIGAIAAWTSIMTFLVLFPMKYFNILRVNTMEEIVGMDVYAHGEAMKEGLFDPNMTKLPGMGGGKMGPLSPTYLNAPASDEGGTPLTLRMDSTGNMRWTPRYQEATPLSVQHFSTHSTITKSR